MIQNANREIPFYSEPPKPVKISIPKIPGNMDITPEFNTDFSTNSTNFQVCT